MAIGYASIQIIPSARGFQSALQSQIGGGVDQVGDRSGRRLGSRLVAGVGRMLKTAGKAGLFAGGAVAGATLVSGFKSAIDQQAGEKTLAGLYGSAKLAKSTMQGLANVAKQSPLDYSSYIGAAESLAYAGLQGKDATQVLRNVGLAIVAVGGSSENMDRATDAVLKMVNAGKVSLDSLQQLSDAGVPIISGLAAKFHVSNDEINKMASDGKIGLQDVISVMKNATGKNFQQALAGGSAAATSFRGELGKLKNRINIALGPPLRNLLDRVTPMLGNIGSVFEDAIAGIPGKFDRLKGVVYDFRHGLDDLAAFDLAQLLGGGDKLEGVFRAVLPAVHSVADSLSGVWDAAKSVFGSLKQVASALAPLAKGALQVAIGALVLAFRGLKLAAQAVAGIMRVIGGFAQKHPAAFRVMAGAILGVAAAWKIYRGVTRTIRAVTAAYRAVQQGATAATLAQGRASKIGAAAARVQMAATKVATGVQRGFTAAMGLLRRMTIGTRIQLAILRVRTLAVAAAQKAAAAASKVMAVGQRILNAAMRANPIGLVITGIMLLVGAFIAAYKKSATFRRIVNGALNAVKKAAAAVVGWFTGSFVPFFTKTIPGAGRAVLRFFRGAWSKITAIITAPIRTAKAIATRLWNLIEKLFRAALRWVRGAFRKGWNKIAGIVTYPIRMARRGVSKIWDGITGIFGSSRRWVGSTWRKGWNKAKQWIGGAVERGRDVAKGALGGTRRAFNATKNWAGSTWRRAWSGMKQWMSDPVGAGKNLIGNAQTATRRIFNGLDNFGRRIFGKRWDKMKNVLSAPVDWAVKMFRRIFGAGGTIRSLFDRFVKAGRRILGRLSGAIRSPINAAVKVVNWMTGGINKLLGFVGVPKGKRIPRITRRARGGSIAGPGSGTSDSVPIMASAGEHVWTAREVRRAGGHSRVEALRARADAGGLGRFARGGRVWPTSTRKLSNNYAGHSGVDIAAGMGSPIYAAAPGRISYAGWGRGYGQAIFERFASGLSAVYGHTSRLLTRAGQAVNAGQTIGKVGSTGRSTGPHLHFEVNASGAFGRASNRQATMNWLQGASGTFAGASTTGQAQGQTRLQRLLGKLSPLQWIKGKVSDAAEKITGTAGPFGNALAKIPSFLFGKVKDWVSSKFFGSGEPGGSGVQRWAPTIRRALGMVGLPQNQRYVSAWLRQVRSESGGDPNIIQQISDINSRLGQRARGLLQVIPPTFRAYHMPGYGNIFNGLHNALAAMRYARARYGERGMLSVIGHGHGYDTGGKWPTGTVGVNQSGTTEAVLTRPQWQTLERLANSGGGAPEVRVFIGDTELKGMVRTEILTHEQGVTRTLRGGRRP